MPEYDVRVTHAALRKAPGGALAHALHLRVSVGERITWSLERTDTDQRGGCCFLRNSNMLFLFAGEEIAEWHAALPSPLVRDTDASALFDALRRVAG